MLLNVTRETQHGFCELCRKWSEDAATASSALPRWLPGSMRQRKREIWREGGGYSFTFRLLAHLWLAPELVYLPEQNLLDSQGPYLVTEIFLVPSPLPPDPHPLRCRRVTSSNV